MLNSLLNFLVVGLSPYVIVDLEESAVKEIILDFVIDLNSYLIRNSMVRISMHVILSA